MKKHFRRYVLALVLIFLATLALLNPSRDDHFSRVRSYALWDAPYVIDETKLQAAGLEYRSYFFFSVLRRADSVYTFGALNWIEATTRLRPLLFALAPSK